MARVRLVAESTQFNGIEYLEVLDRLAMSGTARQQTLIVHFLKDITAPPVLGATNVRITGGSRVKDIRVLWAYPGTRFTAGSPPPEVAGNEFLAIQALIQGRLASRSGRVLVVRTDRVGDFSQYEISLVTAVDNPAPPEQIDRRLSCLCFSFKVECPSQFDCAGQASQLVDAVPKPNIDYLSKDYDSFVRLMTDRLSLLMPNWKERNPADVGIMLVELLAYAGDQLSYYQDAVANEAYLETARRRMSVRRHARLLDYRLGEGTNARTWVRFGVSAGSTGDGAILPAGTELLSRRPSLPLGTVSDVDARREMDAGATVFETMHPVLLHAACNEIRIHDWGSVDCDSAKIPRGTTQLALCSPAGSPVTLAAGNYMAIVEVASPDTMGEADADDTKRHVVRLTRVSPTQDPLVFDAKANPPAPQQLIIVEWAAEDALPFEFSLRKHPTSGVMATVVWGNIALADHGRTVSETVVPSYRGGRAEAGLSKGPVTHQGLRRTAAGTLVVHDGLAPATFEWRGAAQESRPCVSLKSDQGDWQVVPDLLESGPFDTDFVVETEDDGTLDLRFGNGINGGIPTSTLDAEYRIGSGTTGNIGASVLAHVVSGTIVIAEVDNLVAAVGGSDPESIERASLMAPHAFRTQERAVTERDYALITERHPEVQKAVAQRRFIGSWDVFFITVDRLGGGPVDAAFKQQLRNFVEAFRLAGHDIEIQAPSYVPLELVLPVCVKPDHLRAQVLARLLEVFSEFDLPNGQRGFFHPDNWTFGQPVFLSQIVAKAMSVPGVNALLTDPDRNDFRFQRSGVPDYAASRLGVLKMGQCEIARVANDPNDLMQGKIEFQLRGGL